MAKTICYGLIIKAQQQNRNCFVISFSTDIEVLDIADFKSNSSKIIDFFTHSFNGGTDLSPAMNKALEMLVDERYKKADVLFVSDFMANDFTDSVRHRMNIAKGLDTRFHALQIGWSSEDQLLSHFDVLLSYNSHYGKIELKN